MRREGLAAAIQEPARAVGLTVDPPLLKELLDEVSDDLGKLPLLEYALKGTWRVVPREGNRLTLNAYGQAGGIDGAVAKRANEIFARLKPAEQDAARRLFVSLVTPGEGRQDTRARASYSEQDEAIRAVVHEFSAADARLLVTGADILAPQHMVEISHEALIREWDLLSNWIDVNRDALRRREHIRARMREWQEKSQDNTLLLPPGLPLEEGRKLLTDHGDVLIEEVEPYINASIAADEGRLSHQAWQRRRRNYAATTAMAILLAAVGLIGWFWSEAREQARLAQAERDKARIQLLAAQARRADAETPENIERAGALALESIEMTRKGKRHVEADAIEAVQSAMSRLPLRVFPHDDSVMSLAVLPDGRLASAGLHGKIKLWPKDDAGEPVVLEGETALWALAVLPDGRLASGGDNGQIKLWPKDGRGEAVVLSHGDDTVTSLAVLRDGRLASGGDDGQIKFWPKDGTSPPVVLAHGNKVTSLAVLRDGRLASGGDDGQIKLWPEDGTGPAVTLTHDGAVTSLAVLPNGRLVSGGQNGRIKLWPNDGTGEPVILAHGSPVWSLAALPDGRLASGGAAR